MAHLDFQCWSHINLKDHFLGRAHFYKYMKVYEESTVENWPTLDLLNMKGLNHDCEVHKMWFQSKNQNL